MDGVAGRDQPTLGGSYKISAYAAGAIQASKTKLNKAVNLSGVLKNPDETGVFAVPGSALKAHISSIAASNAARSSRDNSRV